jgi:hypothetical protein
MQPGHRSEMSGECVSKTVLAITGVSCERENYLE